MSDYNIVVAGTGYVGMSLPVLLSQYNKVAVVDVVEDKVNKINNKISPVQDEYIEKYLAEKNLYPSCIIVGTDLDDEGLVAAAHSFAGLVAGGCFKRRRENSLYGL